MALVLHRQANTKRTTTSENETYLRPRQIHFIGFLNRKEIVYIRNCQKFTFLNTDNVERGEGLQKKPFAPPPHIVTESNFSALFRISNKILLSLPHTEDFFFSFFYYFHFISPKKKFSLLS